MTVAVMEIVKNRMKGKEIEQTTIRGLSIQQIPALQQQYGDNIFQADPPRRFMHMVLDIVREPMFILLVVACTIYFVLSQIKEGFMMVAAMLFVAAISIYQDMRSTRALKALKKYTEPKTLVIRDGIEALIDSDKVVPGDVVVLEEGVKIPADAIVLRENDLTVDESIITGESAPVEKSYSDGLNILYQGSTINTGKCYAKITNIGSNTVLGKLGNSISGYHYPKTLLQQQITKFVRGLAIFGISAFFAIWLINYIKTGDLIISLLFGLTLAMASIPEEIPVAFSSFMALGAYQMGKLGIISRQPQTIENLGAVSVICLDKTGTITENKMKVKTIYEYEKDEIVEIRDELILDNYRVLKYALLASEVDPFDAMEKAIWDAYRQHTGATAHEKLKLTYEYALQGKPPMMTHVYEYEGIKKIAAKGAVERIIKICGLDGVSATKVTDHVRELASKGFRVLGVASAVHTSVVMPIVQDEFNWQFEGLVALYDPPKKNINDVFKKIYDAKITIKLLTGDHPETAVYIAKQTGIKNPGVFVTGNQVMDKRPEELKETVKAIHIYARMFPEAKLKVIEALKANKEIVAMTGDGVNDAPALKSSHIGIAMGKKGTEIARQAADLILTDDDLEKVVEAIRQGRRIFTNLKKAVRYIVSIHIPIILTAALPLLFGWKYPNIFTPVHIIFLELIMGPTCSIFYEREPVEKNSMLLKPRNRTVGLFQSSELFISVMQGIIISAGVLLLYYFFMTSHSLEETRTLVFTTLLLSNIFLTFANRSVKENFVRTIRYKNNLAVPVFIVSVLFLAGISFVEPLRNMFGMTAISFSYFLLCLAVAFASVWWFEVYKTNLEMVYKPGIAGRKTD
jgi:P-type Ca2+ transporter type 2C